MKTALKRHVLSNLKATLLSIQRFQSHRSVREKASDHSAKPAEKSRPDFNQTRTISAAADAKEKNVPKVSIRWGRKTSIHVCGKKMRRERGMRKRRPKKT